jgi:type IV pilus assembly protein PilW
MKGKSNKTHLLSEKGFTIVEILVAVAISGIVMAGVYSSYSFQQKSYVIQESVAGAQQNLRSALYFMEREIRMAGCNPTEKGIFGFSAATATNLQFTEDISDDPADDDDGDGNGDDDPDGILQPREDITYTHNVANLTLTRQTAGGGGAQVVADNIEALNFEYFDKNGTIIPLPITAVTLPDIRSVQISMIARTDNTDPTYTDTATFAGTPFYGSYPIAGDHHRRKLLTSLVKCRNLGITD